MRKIWDTFKDEEEEKKPLGSQFGGGWGLSDLGKKTEEEEKSPIWATFEPAADVGVGASATGGATLTKPVKKFGVGEETEVPSSQFGISDLNKPEQMGKIQKGVIGIFGTWEAKKKAMPELQKMEDFAIKVAKNGKTPHERVAYIQEILTGQPKDKTLEEIKGQKNINIFFINPPEKYKEAVNLESQLIDILQRKESQAKIF